MSSSSETEKSVRRAFALSIPRAAIYALSCFAILPPNPEYALEVDQRDRALTRLRCTAVYDLIDAGLVEQTGENEVQINSSASPSKFKAFPDH